MQRMRKHLLNFSASDRDERGLEVLGVWVLLSKASKAFWGVLEKGILLIKIGKAVCGEKAGS